ncbi:MAG: N(4)-(beta-N-acetylglucosaminyl)-L-asparaginase [Phycisphaerae bacterium]|nr:N(4)-(beta-N-acetylglucosaminyl)-L-asparaginase [Phycisphaerae bacterium]
MGMNVSRRMFVGTIGLGAAALAGARAMAQPAAKAGAGGPVSISSANGLRATARALEVLKGGGDPLDACVEGVRIVEDDPADNSVGLGGLPNEEGVVELDASVMHGPTHRSGAVAALRNIRNPVLVAREVARRTDHVLLVGEGALRFARRVGFKEEELLTEAARKAWLKWRSELSRDDDWLAEDEFDLGGTDRGEHAGRGEEGIGRARRLAGLGVEFTTGTIHCSSLTAGGDLSGCTSTSGLSWKLPGRVGDSPIIGAGLYCDNGVGSAGATGRGEAVMQVCGARTIVARMEAGDSPTEACLAMLKMIVDRTRVKRLRNAAGRPDFNVTAYALRKDGAHGSASIWSGGQYSVSDAAGDRHEASAYLFEKAG